MDWYSSKTCYPLFLPVLHPTLLNVNEYFLVGGVLSFLLAAVSLSTQYRLKHYLAFSTIGHMGAMIIGFAIGDYHSFWFYSLIYFTASVDLFLILAELPGIDLMKHLCMITNNYPLAFAFMIALLTMAAVPPFSGFYAKLHLFVQPGSCCKPHIIMLGSLA